MARKIIKKYIRKPRVKWSTRLQNFNQSANIAQNYQGAVAISYKLCENPVQSQDTVSQKFTIKNIKVDAIVENAATTAQAFLENFQFYILYIPQGYPTTTTDLADIPFSHPEWIMAYRYMNTPLGDTSTSYLPVRVSSRLARNLDTGDRIMLVVLGQVDNAPSSATVYFRGLVKYNTKAN